MHHCVCPKGRLSHSLRKGVITLIHKDYGLDRNDLANYRPITLTNTDYKIYTKALAIRIQQVTKQIIHDDQIGFIKGRNITSHLRLIDDLTSYLNEKDQTGALIALDFSKAFDTVEKLHYRGTPIIQLWTEDYSLHHNSNETD
eukprot:TRINITY_DN128253_c0_g1_i4.p1 TRINITY_DN128253_c0_g1~~TRINITY_DN128253_c0_g1_i4.p1  ORF type:complete len:143 (+),score=10.78 TRINITY_DN128253_c0_g1_i4:15-443(+)